jgi:hypothetical protein
MNRERLLAVMLTSLLFVALGGMHLSRWVDWNINILQGISEVIEEKPRYVCIQAPFTESNLDRVQWFASTCHSRGLRVTWYPDEKALHQEDIVSALRSFTTFGDDIGLSFGQTFFNQMKPSERLEHTYNYMSTFRDTFGYYPYIVQSYYIDAYTLNHISMQYSAVKAAIAYVNHEVYCDNFKSAGAYYMPYYPSKMNTLVPSRNEDKIDIVVLPFVHRDPTNCILHQDITYSLNPQDGCKVAENWTNYFAELFQVHTEGWDLFGLALYLIDLAYPDLPTKAIEQDLSYIQEQVQFKNCPNVLDSEFVEWFRSRFPQSPSYRWTYQDSIIGFSSSLWYFTPENRVGYVDGELLDSRKYHREYEGCYENAVCPYDNSMPLNEKA